MSIKDNGQSIVGMHRESLDLIFWSPYFLKDEWTIARPKWFEHKPHERQTKVLKIGYKFPPWRSGMWK